MAGDGELTLAAHIELQGLSKRFGATRAVRDLTLTIERGTVHAIVGENGAGKSTVGKLIAGVLQPSAGTILVDGAPSAFASPRQALASGIAMMDQELALVPTRSVLANIFLGAETMRRGRLDVGAQRRRFDELISRTGFALDPDADVGSLSTAQQQKVEILRAVSRDAELIIMDEPTSPLTGIESEQLYEVIAQLRAAGTTIIYVSHFLEEVLRVSDVVTVMRDGAHVNTTPAADATVAGTVRAMLGRPLELTFPEQRPSRSGEPVLEVRGLSTSALLDDVSFALRPGEIVGLAGLIGSGRSELARAVFGADPISDGEVLLDGMPGRLGSPREAIVNGVVLLSESRQASGLVMTRSIAENVVMARTDRVSRRGILQMRRRRELVTAICDQLDIRATGPDAPVRTLSGGNQQKVLFAKCLVAEPRVLLVDEPTRGVDVGAKRAIYELIVSLAAEGMAILVISSELEEVMGLAHRILVMCRGRLVAELPRELADEETILAAAVGAPASV